MRSGWCSRSDMGPSCVRHTKAPDCCPGLPRTDPPGLPLGTDSLEATKVGTGGHGSGRRTPSGVLLYNVPLGTGIPLLQMAKFRRSDPSPDSAEQLTRLPSERLPPRQLVVLTCLRPTELKEGTRQRQRGLPVPPR